MVTNITSLNRLSEYVINQYESSSPSFDEIKKAYTNIRTIANNLQSVFTNFESDRSQRLRSDRKTGKGEERVKFEYAELYSIIASTRPSTVFSKRDQILNKVKIIEDHMKEWSKADKKTHATGSADFKGKSYIDKQIDRLKAFVNNEQEFAHACLVLLDSMRAVNPSKYPIPEAWKPKTQTNTNNGPGTGSGNGSNNGSKNLKIKQTRIPTNLYRTQTIKDLWKKIQVIYDALVKNHIPNNFKTQLGDLKTLLNAAESDLISSSGLANNKQYINNLRTAIENAKNNGPRKYPKLIKAINNFVEDINGASIVYEFDINNIPADSMVIYEFDIDLDNCTYQEFDACVQEAAATAALLNVKNQLMQIVGDAFEFIGGSLMPKFTMKSKDKPEVEINVDVNGQNVEATPVINGQMDLLHKRRGIAIMRAAQIIAEFAKSIVDSFKK